MIIKKLGLLSVVMLISSFYAPANAMKPVKKESVQQKIARMQKEIDDLKKQVRPWEKEETKKMLPVPPVKKLPVPPVKQLVPPSLEEFERYQEFEKYKQELQQRLSNLTQSERLHYERLTKLAKSGYSAYDWALFRHVVLGEKRPKPVIVSKPLRPVEPPVKQLVPPSLKEYDKYIRGEGRPYPKPIAMVKQKPKLLSPVPVTQPRSSM